MPRLQNIQNGAKLGILVTITACLTTERGLNVPFKTSPNTPACALPHHREGIERLTKLIVFELILAFFLLCGTAYEWYIILEIILDVISIEDNPYAASGLLSIAAYFPIWTLVHTVLLVYTWIPREKLQLYLDRFSSFF